MSDVRRRIFYNPDEDTLYSLARQDVEPILDHNRNLRDLDQPKTDGLKHVASIPNVIIERWLSEAWKAGNTTLAFGSPEFDALIKRKLRDPEWAYLRTDAPPPAHRR